MLPIVLFSQIALCAEVLHFQASYSVPVENPELQKYANFELTNYTVINDGPHSEISYDLPLELTGGEKVSVRLQQIQQAENSRAFSGPVGTADCIGAWKNMRCQTQFAIRPDQQKIRDYIAANVSLDRQAQVTAVAINFSTEPIGISQTFSVDKLAHKVQPKIQGLDSF